MKRVYPLPGTLNVFLVFSVFAVQCTLIIAASHTSLKWQVPIALLFSFLFLTNYSLMHEGGHKLLHPNKGLNKFLDVIAGLNFPTSGTMMSLTHDAHHFCNRTRHEMFDCYYEKDNKFVKWLQWYSILLGFFWFSIVLGTLLVSIFPSFLKNSLFKKARSSSELFNRFNKESIRQIRIECLLCIIYFFILFKFCGVQLLPTAVLFALGGFNWSTRQYVQHHRSSRDVMEGAFNLRTSKIMQWIMLNYNFHHEHHSKPGISWIYLPEAAGGKTEMSYLKQYLRQWKPPYLLEKECPEPLDGYK